MRDLKPGPGAALVCGSVAFDTIMNFPDRFAAHILPGQMHILNVSFMVPQMRREFGGCAGNIAYNLRLLGSPCYPMATVGHDFAPYAQWLDRCGVTQDHLRVLDSEHTAQCFLTTDLDNNQINSFHPGAMQQAHLNRVADAPGIGIGIVAPDGRQAMIEHAAQFAAAGIAFMFDPGQGLPMFGAKELNAFIAQASWIAVNDYEWQQLQDKTGRTAADLAHEVQALIVTRGAKGSSIYSSDSVIEIPCARPGRVVDPTGCGDAYRAGLIYGLMQGLPWQTTGRVASLMGAIKIESRGTQNHRFTRNQFRQRFVENFGPSLEALAA